MAKQWLFDITKAILLVFVHRYKLTIFPMRNKRGEGKKAHGFSQKRGQT